MKVNRTKENDEKKTTAMATQFVISFDMLYGKQNKAGSFGGKTTEPVAKDDRASSKGRQSKHHRR